LVPLEAARANARLNRRPHHQLFPSTKATLAPKIIGRNYADNNVTGAFRRHKTCQVTATATLATRPIHAEF
jgi:hypothetical protein